MVLLVDAFIEDRERRGLKVSPKIAGFAKKNTKYNPNSSLIPVPNPIAVKLENGMDVIYKSNLKHTKGMRGNRLNAGIEPKNSFELFENSIQHGKKATLRIVMEIFINLTLIKRGRMALCW